MLEWLQNNLVIVISASIILILIVILSLFKRTGPPLDDQDEDEDITDSPDMDIIVSREELPAKTSDLNPDRGRGHTIPPANSQEKGSEDIAVEILEGLDIKEENNSRPPKKNLPDISVNRQEPEEIDLTIPNETDLQLPVDLGMQFIGEEEMKIKPAHEPEIPSAPHKDKKEILPEPAPDDTNDFQLPDALDLEWPVEPEPGDENT